MVEEASLRLREINMIVNDVSVLVMRKRVLLIRIVKIVIIPKIGTIAKDRHFIILVHKAVLT